MCILIRQEREQEIMRIGEEVSDKVKETRR